jgi:hypothetical protein
VIIVTTWFANAALRLARSASGRPGTDLALRSPGGNDMSNRYSVVCMTCRYQSSYSSRWEANIDVAAHLRDNPTHSVTVVEEGQGATRRKAS